MKQNIKSGDSVVVIAGNDKGKTAKVLQVFPRTGRVLLEGINKRKHHLKKSQENTEGAIVEREKPIAISNIMAESRYTSKVKAKHAAV
jgi:large subunit ribosomal protein L24